MLGDLGRKGGFFYLKEVLRLHLASDSLPDRPVSRPSQEHMVIIFCRQGPLLGPQRLTARSPLDINGGSY
jgi:hypothetical protein